MNLGVPLLIYLISIIVTSHKIAKGRLHPNKDKPFNQTPKTKSRLERLIAKKEQLEAENKGKEQHDNETS